MDQSSAWSHGSTKRRSHVLGETCRGFEKQDLLTFMAKMLGRTASGSRAEDEPARPTAGKRGDACSTGEPPGFVMPGVLRARQGVAGLRDGPAALQGRDTSSFHHTKAKDGPAYEPSKTRPAERRSPAARPPRHAFRVGSLNVSSLPEAASDEEREDESTMQPSTAGSPRRIRSSKMVSWKSGSPQLQSLDGAKGVLSSGGDTTSAFGQAEHQHHDVDSCLNIWDAGLCLNSGTPPTSSEDDRSPEQTLAPIPLPRPHRQTQQYHRPTRTGEDSLQSYRKKVARSLKKGRTVMM
jgi:hypothetical protein